jgi:hypothetical protein
VSDSTDLVDGIEGVVRKHVIARMPADESGEVMSMDLRSLLSVYWTWRARFPANRPRRVHRSRELDGSSETEQHAGELSELERKIRAGEDLTPHLSERVQMAFVSDRQRPSLPRRTQDADRDRMLSAWGIHHLHLSSTPWKGGFNARGPDLLYAMLRPDDAYLLGIYTHADWERRQLVEIAVRNWPDAGLFLKSDTAIGTTSSWTDEERRDLRRAHINEVLIEVDGSFYGPPGLGLTAAGGSFAAARRAMAYMEQLRQLRENLDDRLSMFGRELDAAAGYPVKGSWTPYVHEDRVGLLRGDDAFIGLPWLDVD